MQRKRHWISKFGYLPPIKRRRFVIKSSSTKTKDTFISFASKYYQKLSITNQKTLEELAPFLKEDFNDTALFLSIFPYLILDLFILKPALFESEFSAAFFVGSQELPNLSHDLVYFDEALSDRISQVVKAKAQSATVIGADYASSPSRIKRWADDPSLRAPVKGIKLTPGIMKRVAVDVNGTRFLSFKKQTIKLTPDLMVKVESLKKDDTIVAINSTTRIDISFQHSLIICQLLSLLSIEQQRHLLKHWVDVLPFLPNWRVALELTCAVANSSLATYLSQLRVFARWLTDSKRDDDIRRESFAHVIFDIAQRKLQLGVLKAYLHTRTYTLGSYRSVKGSFGALSFFYKHLTGASLFTFFPELKISMKSLEQRFLNEKDGSIALPMHLIRDLLDFILDVFVSKKIESGMLYNLCILSFWFMLRVGEAARLCFDHCVLYTDPVLNVRKLRFTLIHPKTRSKNFPDQFITLTELPNNDLCPISAFQRIQLLAKEGQKSLFVDRKGNSLSTNTIGDIFRALIKEWKTCTDVPQGKLTFHVFRISSIGHHVIDLGLSIFEVQSISRHKYGSRVTEDVYLAKSKHEIAIRTAAKISALDDPTKQTQQTPEWMRYLSAPTQHIFKSFMRF